jgi:type I restriction enzyme S subunit
LGLVGEWREIRLGDLVDEGVLAISDGYRVRNEELGPEGIPFVRGGDIGDGWINTTTEDHIRPEFANRVRAKITQPGDVAFITKGTVGRAGRLREGQPPVVFAPQVAYWRVLQPEVLDSAFLFYLVRSHPFQSALYGAKSHGAMVADYVSISQQHDFRLQVPDIDSQRAIAHILGTLDDKIELNRRMNETLESIARALFQSWFVDFDPVRAKAESRDTGLPKHIADLFPDSFEESELGEIPKGWRATKLGTETKRCGGAIQTGPFGSQLHASDYVAEGVPVVMPKDISGRRVSTASIARIQEHDAERLSRHRLQSGDVVYSRRGDVERHALIGPREIGWLCGTGCLLVRLGPRWPSPMFASFALDRPETRGWISQHAIGATMPNLNTGILSDVPLVMPSDEILRAFAHAADPIQNLVVARDAQATTLARVRDELLPRLLSGELELPAVECFAEASA